MSIIDRLKEWFGAKASAHKSNPKKVKIGNQIWMTGNLNVSHFRNGDAIPHAKTDEEWERAGKNKQPAWCYYDNEPENGAKYGKLYNWYAVNDRRGLAPEGWKIPSDADWTQLTDYLGGASVAGGKMKETGTKRWESPNHLATNESGFTGLPGGYRLNDGNFYDIGNYSIWWSSTVVESIYAWYRYLYYANGFAYRLNFNKEGGLSVRCLRDVSNSSISITSVNQGKILLENDEYSTENPKSFKEAKIGNQIWMAENLNVSHFRNGDPIPHAKTDEEWKRAGVNIQPAWCYFGNDPENGAKYGKLYNWYAVNDRRGLAPEGWKIPSDADWTQLTDYLGGASVAGGKMKETGTKRWESPNHLATNESGFTGLPGGYRNNNGNFNKIGYNGYWWIYSKETYGYICFLNYASGPASMILGGNRGNGLSVRCFRDYFI